MFVSMWHVEAANIKVFSVLQLQFGPQYLAVCGQFRLFNRDRGQIDEYEEHDKVIAGWGCQAWRSRAHNLTKSSSSMLS
ncbi:hypothetical protein ACOMHN_038182 [Nucella lapillus]